MEWYRNLRIVLSVEDKLSFLEQPIPAMPVPPAGQKFAFPTNLRRSYERRFRGLNVKLLRGNCRVLLDSSFVKSKVELRVNVELALVGCIVIIQWQGEVVIMGDFNCGCIKSDSWELCPLLTLMECVNLASVQLIFLKLTSSFGFKDNKSETVSLTIANLEKVVEPVRMRLLTQGTGYDSLNPSRGVLILAMRFPKNSSEESKSRPRARKFFYKEIIKTAVWGCGTDTIPGP
ncbi:hypothetical protein Tco_0849123 [Tanacetum coccineum]